MVICENPIDTRGIKRKPVRSNVVDVPVVVADLTQGGVNRYVSKKFGDLAKALDNGINVRIDSKEGITVGSQAL